MNDPRDEYDYHQMAQLRKLLEFNKLNQTGQLLVLVSAHHHQSLSNEQEVNEKKQKQKKVCYRMSKHTDAARRAAGSAR